MTFLFVIMSYVGGVTYKLYASNNKFTSLTHNLFVASPPILICGRATLCYQNPFCARPRFSCCPGSAGSLGTNYMYHLR